jgi:hypothetical protein
MVIVADRNDDTSSVLIGTADLLNAVFGIEETHARSEVERVDDAPTPTMSSLSFPDVRYVGHSRTEVRS